MRLPAIVLVVVLLAAIGVRARPQNRADQPPIFRAGVDLVQVDVSVLDGDRRPVRGLTAADFVVREDGKVRPIAAFSAVDLPEPAPPPPVAWKRDVAPDVVTNLIPREGRLVVILLDHTIKLEDMPWARRTAEAAVEQLGPFDLAAVLLAAGRGIPQNFTADKSLLLASIRRPFLDLPVGGAETEAICYCGVCTVEQMAVVADALRDVPHRRKVLLYIGASLPTVNNDIKCFAEVREAREKLMRAAGLANMTIHTFDSNLLETLAPRADYRGSPMTNRSGMVGAHLKRQGDLTFYAEETGGRAIKNTNAPWEPLPAVFDESRSYYVLGFTPAVPKSDGRYHDVKVEVKRRGLTVHSRRGYLAGNPLVAEKPAPLAAGAPPKSLLDSIASVWPESGLPLAVSAAAFAEPGTGNGVVAVVVRVQEPVGASKPLAAAPGALPQAEAALLVGAYDRDGKPLDQHVQKVVVTAPSATVTQFEYDVVSRLRLKRGRHEIRVGVADSQRGLRGSVYTYVEVPDFSRADLTLSGIVLGTMPAARGGLDDLLPLSPVAQRQFGTGRAIHAFARVYEPEAGPAPVTMAARIQNDQGQMVFERGPAPVEMSAGAPRSADYLLELPLTTLPPGEYLLTIEAKRGSVSARRDVRFGVR